MTMSRDQIRAAAFELEPAEREALAEELLLSIDPSQRDAIDRAWLEEARRRDAAFRAGSMRARPVQEVIDQLERRARE